MAKLVQLNLSKVDVQGLTDVKNLSDNPVGELKHLLAQVCICGLLAVATNKERCKLEAHANGPGSVVAIMLTSVQEPKIGDVVGLRELPRLSQLGRAVVTGKDH